MNHNLFAALREGLPAEGPPEVELVLEPNANPAGKAFQEGMFTQGIPVAAFEVDDITRETARLTAMGSPSRGLRPPGPVVIAIFADTCGSLIQISARNQ